MTAPRPSEPHRRLPLSMPPPPVRLASIATAVPPHELPQDLVERTARRVLGGRYPMFERLAPSFRNSGVVARQSVVPLEWFERPQDWASRNAAYLDGAGRLFERAARTALERASWRADEVDVVVTVSSTGIATPTLEARAAGALGLRRDVRRVPLFGLGCAGGATGLAHAAELARARPGAKVLLVAVECCTLAFRDDRLEKSDIIATVLFGDGAGAACVSTEADGPALGAGVEHSWPDTLDIMGWNVDRDGFGVVFDRAIPPFAEEYFADAANVALMASGMTMPARPLCHPGGAKVVEAIETALGLGAGTLDIEREVLRDHGNMSAPTVLFVLERFLARGSASEPTLIAALGPGFTASFLPLVPVGAQAPAHEVEQGAAPA